MSGRPTKRFLGIQTHLQHKGLPTAPTIAVRATKFCRITVLGVKPILTQGVKAPEPKFKYPTLPCTNC